ncbi:hypothetical protein D7V93_03525 [Corallococcus llansteffanensis]|uniref:Uncharacterized protein n=1 Tax=Corallococcus llansteffanensis TaxID=2316731 RepID=A0A3A8QED5_9BACT|nr:hypothetical protein D7V93_03525 [Corallococcus llansteffanensis]
MLLTACIGTVATEQATSDDVSSNEHVGAPLSITTAAPKATRRVVVRATASKPPDKAVEGELRVRVTARWIPDDPAQTTSPWIQLLVSHADHSSGPDASGVLVAGTPVTLEAFASLFGDCKLNTGCEWPMDVGFQMQPNAVPGTVELEWTAQATAHAVDTSSVPKGFTVSVSAP